MSAHGATDKRKKKRLACPEAWYRAAGGKKEKRLPSLITEEPHGKTMASTAPVRPAR